MRLLMAILKVLHLLSIFFWVGNLLTISGVLVFFPKDDKVQSLAKTLKKIYFFSDLPAMIITLLTGLFLFLQVTFEGSLGWFHMKLTFVAILIILDQILRSFLQKLEVSSSDIKYKILHIAIILSLIGLLSSIYLVRKKESEWRTRFKREFNIQP